MRIPFFFDDFHFCRSRVIGLDMTENRIFTLSYDNLSIVSQNVLKFYQQLTGEERRIPFIFDDFHFCRSRVIGLDMTENRIFISSLPVKRGGSLSFLVGTISNVLVMEIGWTDVGSVGYILVSCAHSNTSSSHFSQQLLMAEILYLVTSFIRVPHIMGSVFGPVRFLLPVCRRAGVS